MDWIELTNEDQLEAIRKESAEKAQANFNTPYVLSAAWQKAGWKRATCPEQLSFHLLDLIRYRSLSNKIEEQFNVYHESPQVLLIRNGECIYDESHNGISMDDIIAQSKN